LPITSDVTVLPGASTQPLDACVSSLASAESGVRLLAVPVEPGGLTEPGLDELLPASAADAIAAFGLTGKAGEAALVPASVAGRAVSVLLLGVGDRSAAALRRAGAELGRRVADGATAATTVVAGEPADGVQAFAEGVLLGGYRFDLKTGQTRQPPGRAWLASADTGGAARAVDRAAAIAEAVGLARDLANQPSLTKSPQWLADQAVTTGPRWTRTWPTCRMFRGPRRRCRARSSRRCSCASSPGDGPGLTWISRARGGQRRTMASCLRARRDSVRGCYCGCWPTLVDRMGLVTRAA
jgi:hypothetical protein